MEITAALDEYFNCHHRMTTLEERAKVAERLYNVLTPATVNTLYTIDTVFSKKRYSPLQVVAQTENVVLVQRLIVDLGADLLLSEGDGIPPLRSLLRTYSSIYFFTLMRLELVHPINRDTILSALTAGVERVTDIPKLLDDLRLATRQSGLSQEDGAELALILEPYIQMAMRSVAWRRRRHLIAMYDSDSVY